MNNKIVIFLLNKQILFEIFVIKNFIDENEIKNEIIIAAFFINIDYFIIKFIIE